MDEGLVVGLVWVVGADRDADYLTFWYRSEERSIRVALILASATLAGAFGGKKKKHLPLPKHPQVPWHKN
jgi:hypothetical protein